MFTGGVVIGKAAGEGGVEGWITAGELVGEKAGDTIRGKMASAFGGFAEMVSLGYFKRDKIAKGTGELMGLDAMEMHMATAPYRGPYNGQDQETVERALRTLQGADREMLLESLGLKRPNSQTQVQTPPPAETTVQTPKELAESAPNLNVTVKVNAEAVDKRFSGHARGGLISTPTLSTLAERGSEIVVPLGEADRKFGLFNLAMAARKLGIPRTDTTNPTRKIPEFPKIKIPESPRNGIMSPRSEVTQNITFAPNIQVTGDNAEEISRSVTEKMRAQFPQFLQEAQEAAERVAYGTA
jgi:hypothetical protein